MVNRLVLGSGSLVKTVVDSMEGSPGTIQVATGDDHLASVLTERGVATEALDVTDERALGQFDDVDIVFVAQETERENLAASRAVRNALSDVYLIAFSGNDATDHGAMLASTADKVVDPGEAIANHVMERVGDPGHQLRQLLGVLRDIDNLAVVSHDNPDPDAIASGVALTRLAEKAGCSADVCYFGEISHQENRAFVNVLGLDLRNLDDDEDLSEFDGIALVDHSRPGVNDQLDADTEIDVVIDHHPPRSPVDARFVDLRSAVGATSTLLVGYLNLFGVPFTEDVATALLFGIHVDTNAFTREVTREDFEAAATLLPTADLGTLERIESPSISPQTYETIANAIHHRKTEGDVLHSCVGQISDRDALAQAADRLMMLEDINTTMVYGVRDGTIYISARSRGAGIDIGETLRQAFDQIGSAGGHADMAGAQITLGLLQAVDEREDSLQDIVEDVVASRFLEAVSQHTGPQVTGVYTSEIDDVEAVLGGQPSPPSTGLSFDTPSPVRESDGAASSDLSTGDSNGNPDGDISEDLSGDADADGANDDDG
jgi:nanoRNase/pAp phosphatase (c-di-AMP/oligoRNAs hydrolase)